MKMYWVAVLIGFLAALSAGGWANAAPADPLVMHGDREQSKDDPTVVMAAVALAEEFDVPFDEAVDRILAQDGLFVLAFDIEKLLGDGFAGSWIDHAEGGVLKIATVGGVKLETGELPGLDDVVWVDADTTWASMRATVESVSDQIHLRAGESSGRRK